MPIFKKTVTIPVLTDKVRLIIGQSRGVPVISNFGLYKAPEEKIKEELRVKGLDVVSVKLENPCSLKYTGEGNRTLANKRHGSMDFHDGQWLGFEGSDLIAILDLGSTVQIKKINAFFLQQQGSWILLPSRVDFEVSDNCVTWKLFDSAYQALKPDDSVYVKNFSVSADCVARYIRVTAHASGLCPEWHEGKGGKCWLFTDEIVVE